MKPLLHGRAIRAIIAVLHHADTPDIERRLRLANQREFDNTSRPDGQPPGRNTNSGGRPSGNDSAVERTIVAREDYTDDPYRRTLDEANDAAQQAADAIRALEAKLNKLDKIQTPKHAGEPGCEAMAIIEVWEPVHARTQHPRDATKTVALGRWAYRFVRVTGRMPTRDELERHHAGKKIRLKVDGEVVNLH